ncbi:MAG: hypothetical protein NXH75_03005 [Halobacteriovoraceae bacterium]|nr:hypothetical protein [Halobacteriovoraceae bacterium]
MKGLILLLALSASLNASAVYGKYKFSMNFEWGSDNERVEFLMNSQGDIKIIDEGNYYNVTSYPFFGIISLDFRSGGDEDYVIASATLEKVGNQTVMTNYCAAIIDGPGGYVSLTGPRVAKLQRWSKSAKKYKALKITASEEDVKKCEKDLIQTYVERGYEVSEY